MKKFLAKNKVKEVLEILKKYTRKFSPGRTSATVLLLGLIVGSVTLLLYGIYFLVISNRSYKNYIFLDNLGVDLGLGWQQVLYKEFKYILNRQFASYLDLTMSQFPKDLFITSFVIQSRELAQNAEFMNYLSNNNLSAAFELIDLEKQAEIFEFYNDFCNEIGFSNERFVELFKDMERLQMMNCEVVLKSYNYGELGAGMIIIAGILAFASVVVGGIIIANLDYDILNRPVIVRMFTRPEEIKLNQQVKISN